MSRFAPLAGLIAAPFTPLHDDGSVHFELVPRYAAFLARNGVQAAFVNGTTGEGLALTVAERQRLVAAWVAAAPPGFKVIVHVGCASVAESCELAAHAQAAGAWGVGCVAAFLQRPGSVGVLADCCAAIAAAAPELPFYYYHIPAATGLTASPLAILAAVDGRIPNFAGIKYTDEDLMSYSLCRRYGNERFDVVFGRDEILICALALGAQAAIGSTYNYTPQLYRRLMDAAAAGDWAEARRLQEWSMRMIRAFVSAGPTPLAAGKSIMKMLGLDCGPTRLPLPRQTPEQYQGLERELLALGLADWSAR